jgi:predicted DNA-binding transcriptional regulator
MPNPQPQVSEEGVEAALARFQELRRLVDERPVLPEPSEQEWLADVLQAALPVERKRWEEEVRERLEWLATKFTNEAAARDRLGYLASKTTPSGVMRECAKEIRTEMASLFPGTEEGRR